MPTDRYQYKPEPWSSHSLILEQLRHYPEGTRILDVGTAAGTLGKNCLERGWILHGVEPVAEWAELSRPYYAEIRGQVLEQVGDDFLADHQVVVCADVLEHMPDPSSQLQRLVDLHPAGTRFLISLPNIANLRIRLHLLFGSFEYTEVGILDRTHLRFFTQRSARRMLENAGLRVQRVLPTPVPLGLVSPFFNTNRLGRWLYRLLAQLTYALPRLLGYQFVIVADKL